jgi:4-amino-4-deoxy-L-arabinose transferase-like glycosyltransferase
MGLLKNNWQIITLAIITLSGFLLRFHNLDWQCLKVDELVTTQAAMQPTCDIIRWSLSVDYNPPLYYLLAHWSSMIFGETSRFAIRFPALILGTLAIPASYLLAKEVKNETLGLLVAALVSFMFPFFYYSQDARAYPLVLFIFLCFSYFAVRIYNNKSDTVTIVMCGVFAALSLWSHYYSLIPMLIIGSYLVYQRKRYLKSLLVAIILIIPMALLFDISQFSTRTTHDLFNVLWISPSMMSTLLLNELFCWSWLIIIPLAAYTLYRYKNDLLRLFAITGLITAVLLIPLAQITATMARYAVLISPLILIIALYPVAHLIDNQKTTAKKIVIFVGFAFLIFVFNFQSIGMWNTFDTCPIVLGTR